MHKGKKADTPLNLRHKVKLATWNVMTLAGIGYEVALIRELARLKLPLVGITEARILGSGSGRVEGATLLHSGGNDHTHGVALVAQPPFCHALTSWQPISDRLLTARLVHKHGHLTAIVAYAPTEPADDHTKDNFYNQLSAATQSVPPHDVLVVLGDFNAVCGDILSDDGKVGPHGSGIMNDNSDRMVTYCGMHNLILPGTWFKRLDIRRWTWYSHDGSTRKESDHIITRERDKGLFKSHRTFRGAEAPANTDHVLLVAELCLTLLKPRKKPDSSIFDIPRLLEDSTLYIQRHSTE